MRATTCSIQSLDHTALARAAKATGQYLNSILAKIEVPTPATTRRSCSPSTATSPRAPARTSSSCATACS